MSHFYLFFAEAKLRQSKRLNLANTCVFVNLTVLIGGGQLLRELKMGAKM
jgi:hypothetical protein